jgi:hypothetical protein
MTVTITAPAAWVAGAAAHLNTLTLTYDPEITDIYDLIKGFLPTGVNMLDPNYGTGSAAVVTVSDGAVPETVRAGPLPYHLRAARAPPPL